MFYDRYLLLLVGALICPLKSSRKIQTTQNMRVEMIDLFLSNLTNTEREFCLDFNI